MISSLSVMSMSTSLNTILTNCSQSIPCYAQHNLVPHSHPVDLLYVHPRPQPGFCDTAQVAVCVASGDTQLSTYFAEKCSYLYEKRFPPLRLQDPQYLPIGYAGLYSQNKAYVSYETYRSGCSCTQKLTYKSAIYVRRSDLWTFLVLCTCCTVIHVVAVARPLVSLSATIVSDKHFNFNFNANCIRCVQRRSKTFQAAVMQTQL